MQNILFVIVMGFVSIANSSDADSNWTKQNVNNKEIHARNNDGCTAEKQKETDNLIIKRLNDQLSALEYQKEAAGKVVDSVKLIRDINTIDYTFANGAQTFETFEIDSNKIIRYVRFRDYSRRMTDEERMFCYHSKKNPESYANVSKNVALEFARKALFIIYGEKEALKFDSLEINEEADYHFYFKVKMKNDNMDWRMAAFTVSANNGQFVSIRTDGLPKKEFDINYKPKVPKEKALEMFYAKVKALHATIDITFIGICDFTKRGICNTPRKTWTIYGQRKDVERASCSAMIIDCETGEIIIDLN